MECMFSFDEIMENCGAFSPTECLKIECSRVYLWVSTAILSGFLIIFYSWKS